MTGATNDSPIGCDAFRPEAVARNHEKSLKFESAAPDMNCDVR